MAELSQAERTAHERTFDNRIVDFDSRDIMPYEKKGPVNKLIEAETHADEVLATSPGEPEGQCSWCDGKRVLMEPDGSKHQPCPHC